MTNDTYPKGHLPELVTSDINDDLAILDSILEEYSDAKSAQHDIDEFDVILANFCDETDEALVSEIQPVEGAVSSDDDEFKTLMAELDTLAASYGQGSVVAPTASVDVIDCADPAAIEANPKLLAMKGLVRAFCNIEARGLDLTKEATYRALVDNVDVRDVAKAIAATNHGVVTKPAMLNYLHSNFKDDYFAGIMLGSISKDINAIGNIDGLSRNFFKAMLNHEVTTAMLRPKVEAAQKQMKQQTAVKTVAPVKPVKTTAVKVAVAVPDAIQVARPAGKPKKTPNLLQRLRRTVRRKLGLAKPAAVPKNDVAMKPLKS